MIEKEESLKIKELEDKINKNKKMLLDINNSLICLCEVLDSIWKDLVDAIPQLLEWAHAEKRFLMLNNAKLNIKDFLNKDLKDWVNFIKIQYKDLKDDKLSTEEYNLKIEEMLCHILYFSEDLVKIKDKCENCDYKLFAIGPNLSEEKMKDILNKYKNSDDEETESYETSDNMVRRMKVSNTTDSKSSEFIKEMKIFGSGTFKDQEEFNREVSVHRLDPKKLKTLGEKKDENKS